MSAATIVKLIAWAMVAGGLVGLVVSARRGGRPGPILAFLALIVAGALTVGIMTFRRPPTVSKADQLEVFARVSAMVLGEHLAQTAPDAKILVVVVAPQAHLEDPLTRLGVEGLKAGLGTANPIVAIDSPRAEAAATGGPVTPEKALRLRRTTRADGFDKLLDAYPECNLVVSFIGLPQNPEAMAVWKRAPEARPRFALIGGSVRHCRNAILAGAVCAAIVTRPDYLPDQTVPEDLRAAFDRRFLLVTPENVEQLAAQHAIFAE